MWCIFFAAGPVTAQSDLQVLLLSGLEDSQTFARDYLRPGTEAALDNLSSGWYHTSEVKKPLRFEFSIVGNASLQLSDHQSFFLDTDHYNNLEFSDGTAGREVSTIFGTNPTAIQVESVYLSASGEERISVFELPGGIGETDINYFPLVFLQARLGVFKGTEIKARYFPKMEYKDVEAGLFGAALQHEITSWLPGADLLPVAIAGLVGYTQMKGQYDFTAQEQVEGENQILKATMDSWIFTAIVSTKIPVFNVHGGIGYASGSSTTEMLGTYVMTDRDTGETIFIVENPLKVKHEIGGLVGSLGISVKLGVLKLSADYNFQEYEVVKVGVHLGF